MDDKTLEFYRSNYISLFERYSSRSPQYIKLFTNIFKPGSKILDIGTGSGRDMKILQDLGYNVYGIEPEEGFISLIKERYPTLNRIEWGSLPDNIPKNYNNFQGILLIAVLQHISNNDLKPSIGKLHDLLVVDGVLLVSIPTKYPSIENNRDIKGRLFHVRIKEQYIKLFQSVGFKLLSEKKSSDALNREGTEWTTLIMPKLIFTDERQ